MKCALDIAKWKARTWAFGTVFPAYSGNFSFPTWCSLTLWYKVFLSYFQPLYFNACTSKMICYCSYNILNNIHSDWKLRWWSIIFETVNWPVHSTGGNTSSLVKRERIVRFMLFLEERLVYIYSFSPSFFFKCTKFFIANILISCILIMEHCLNENLEEHGYISNW